MSAMFAQSQSGVKSKKASYKFRTLILYAFLVIYFGAMSGFFSYVMYQSLSAIGMQKLIPMLVVFAATLLTLISSVFTSGGYLYRAKDLQLLLALPVSKLTILCSKFFGLYLSNLTVAALLCLPSGIVYLVLDGGSVTGYISLAIVTLSLPLLPIVIGCIISYFIGLATRGMKHKNVVTTVISVVFFIGVMLLSQNSESIFEYIENNGATISESLSKWYLPAGLAANAISGVLIDLLWFVLINIIPCAIVLPLISIRYFSLVEAYNQTFKKNDYVYRSQDERKSTKFVSCFSKEIRRLFSSANYFLNSCAGALMLIVFIVMFASQELGNEIAAMGDNGVFLGSLITSLTSVLASTLSSTTSASISMEGRSLWIYKTVPIDTMTVFNAKLSVNIVIFVPVVLIYTIVMSVMFGLPALYCVAISLLAVSSVLFVTVMGLINNLFKPKLNWVNEAQAVKQSTSVMITMLESLGVTLISALVLVALPILVPAIPFPACAGIAAILFLITTALLYKVLKGWGVRKFASIN